MVDRLILTQFSFPRVASVAELMQQIETIDATIEIQGEEDWKKAYQKVVQEATPNEVIFITGSLYFISEVRQYLKNN